jgi:hypothetical protein
VEGFGEKWQHWHYLTSVSKKQGLLDTRHWCHQSSGDDTGGFDLKNSWVLSDALRGAINKHDVYTTTPANFRSGILYSDVPERKASLFATSWGRKRGIEEHTFRQSASQCCTDSNIPLPESTSVIVFVS